MEVFMQPEKKRILLVFGGQSLLGPAARSNDMDLLIRKGFPFRASKRVKEILELSNSQFAETLGISERTWARIQKSDKRLPFDASDRLYRVARIYAFACEVLEDEKEATKWIHSPQTGLGGKVPLDLLHTEAGAREVEDLLGRIEHGVIS
jgi:putative toxin-antitoxin system antitoxin component (TIGR02293 family)